MHVELSHSRTGVKISSPGPDGVLARRVRPWTHGGARTACTPISIRPKHLWSSHQRASVLAVLRFVFKPHSHVTPRVRAVAAVRVYSPARDIRCEGARHFAQCCIYLDFECSFNGKVCLFFFIVVLLARVVRGINCIVPHIYTGDLNS